MPLDYQIDKESNLAVAYKQQQLDYNYFNVRLLFQLKLSPGVLKQNSNKFVYVFIIFNLQNCQFLVEHFGTTLGCFVVLQN